MNIIRRTWLAWLATLPTMAVAQPTNENLENLTMYGLIGKIVAVPENREELANILINGISGMPGCLSYIVALDRADENALWITEVWESKEHHTASLSLESVQAAIKLGKALIAGFAERHETMPVGGQGLGLSKP